MSTFQDNCPHCGTKSVGFTILHESMAAKDQTRPWDTLAICGHCSRSVLASFWGLGGNSPAEYLNAGHGNQLGQRTIAPSLPDTGAPKHTPPNVSHFYEQGMENMPGKWDAAGSMFRKALDTGLKAKFPDIKGKLFARIEQAAAQNKLTPELAEWSHQIRLDGNDAAHDEDPFSQEDAERLQAFTNLVLLYLFNLPGMLHEARGAQAADEPASAAAAPAAAGSTPGTGTTTEQGPLSAASVAAGRSRSLLRW